MSEPKIANPAEDRLLRADIRLLGRILGDTVREQSGAQIFDTVEYIRQNSVRFRRDEDVTARHNLEATLNSLPPQQALQIIRAFGFFSHLANIAEDQHQLRDLRARKPGADGAARPAEGSIAHALTRMFRGDFLTLPMHPGRALVINLHAIHSEISLA